MNPNHLIRKMAYRLQGSVNVPINQTNSLHLLEIMGINLLSTIHKDLTEIKIMLLHIILQDNFRANLIVQYNSLLPSAGDMYACNSVSAIRHVTTRW